MHVRRTVKRGNQTPLMTAPSSPSLDTAGPGATGELARACFLAEKERRRTEPQSSNSIYSVELGGGARTRRRLESSRRAYRMRLLSRRRRFGTRACVKNAAFGKRGAKNEQYTYAKFVYSRKSVHETCSRTLSSGGYHFQYALVGWLSKIG